MFSWFARARSSRPDRVETALPSCQGKSGSLAFLATLDDEELAIRLASGTDDALTILFERHCGLVFRIARRASILNGRIGPWIIFSAGMGIVSNVGLLYGMMLVSFLHHLFVRFDT